MSTKVFAKVDNGAIVEYPVFANHIAVRGHPVEWYTEVEFDDKPEVPEFHYLKETVSLKRGKVLATYTVVPISLESMLADLWHSPDGSEVSLTIGEIDPAIVQRIADLATEAVQKKLDDFAKERKYDGIVSACSYFGSQNATFKADAERAQLLRDQAWAALYGYMAKLMSGIVPVPKTLEDIFVDLPAFTWE